MDPSIGEYPHGNKKVSERFSLRKDSRTFNISIAPLAAELLTGDECREGFMGRASNGWLLETIKLDVTAGQYIEYAKP